MTKFARDIGNRNSLIVDFGFPLMNSEEIKDKNLTLLNSLFYMTVIDAVSFLDEYQQVFGVKTEKYYKDRIIIVKAINKPFISKISEWKDLKEFRNQLLAHNLRKGKNGDFVFSIENIDYNAPRDIYDLFLLSNLILFSTETLNSEFENEIKKIDSAMYCDIKPKEKFFSKDDVSRITVELMNEANKEKICYSRNYNFTINKPLEWDKI
jgi:hypothetical protein